MIEMSMKGTLPAYMQGTSDSFIGVSPTNDLLYSNLMNVVWMLGLWFVIKVIHKRKLRTLVTARPKIDWKQAGWGFAVFFGLMIAFQVLDFIIFPGDTVLNNFSWGAFFYLFLVVLFLVPIQTTVEELFFRGFLLQWFAKKIASPITLSIIIAAIFGSLHFSNPEMGRSAVWVGLDYIFTGFMLTWIAVKIGSLELSIGAHAANNMFLFWFISDEQSVGGELPSIFKVTDVNPMLSFLMTAAILIIFYVLSRRKYLVGK
ncbi:CPBP family intramembrane glutamic endopeptidase [Bacillus sp. V5-8f]|uniref:CPBP family intramembrane glutamic endopeptidase n=1 Tax=Bacillus sp. V5-8f TaxID=2053044 RepID=UPI000C778F1A|nr:CPBP family intramembrane glutamic endopeptidase [Bacillus sp. V5-8f]PLT34445.1 CPBP family intramembrane metalloprotease domain-containing protein [Bacillus sp. V5-8f]